MNKPLIVYKASAGSGKTFTLAIEYIKLLIHNPYDFRSILAVTFTNKATEEMKTRILSQLYGIWKQLDDSRSYTEAICAGLDASPAFVSRQAGLALRLLLHNYNGFRIETIDSFFQSILRNLSRELDLTANLRIELNDKQIEEQAVDALIEGLGPHDELLQWIMRFITDNISEDKSWNVIGSIKSFGTTIFREFYKEARGQLAGTIGNGALFDEYKSVLYSEKASAAARMKGYADTFFDIISDNGLVVDDFASKDRGVCGFFLKIQKGTLDEKIVGKRITECMEQPDKWVSKTHPNRKLISALAEEKLIGLLKKAVDDRPVQWCRYKSAELTLRHLSQLRLIGSIEQKVRELNETSNRFLLSDTQYLLMSLINDSDSPFIYEKIGALLKFIMIDEFQDTSTIQWRNFKVLLADCMSREAANNIIVGDVKQSIYRWRDSDWRLLNDIEHEFPHPDRQLDIRNLGTNYRSERNIIEFNNAFFSAAAEKEYAAQAEGETAAAEQLRSAYSDVCQGIPEHRRAEGYVSIELLPPAEYQQQTLEGIAERVRQLTALGIPQNEIAILVRNNKYIPLIAGYFAEHEPSVSIVSDEAFRLDASIAVRVIVNALHLLNHPDDSIAKVFLAKAYQNAVCGNNITDDEITGYGGPESLLPKTYVDSMESLRRTPLYDLAERIYYIFQLKRLDDQSAYVCAFFDQLCNFTSDMAADIDTFVSKWDESIGSTTIQSNKLNGIRLISIHKSKGLEFNNVILPFCDWQMEKTSGNIIWCRPETAPFNMIPLIPVDYGTGLMGTVYEKEYVRERLQNCVDNLNLLYVAFTRASRNLFVIGKYNATNSRSELIQECLPQVADVLGDARLCQPDSPDEPMTFEYGTLSLGVKKKSMHTDNMFLEEPETEGIVIETYRNTTEFRQSNRSKEFTETTNAEKEKDNYIKIGSILHKVFSSIATTADIGQVLAQLRADGILPTDSNKSQTIIDMLHKRLTDSRVKDWFSGKWTLFNECSILSMDGNGQLMERRPDRVMTDGKRVIVVDFKFGTPREEHHRQVGEYMELISSMGYADVKGYLWYVYNNRIEEV